MCVHVFVQITYFDHFFNGLHSCSCKYSSAAVLVLEGCVYEHTYSVAIMKGMKHKQQLLDRCVCQWNVASVVWAFSLSYWYWPFSGLPHSLSYWYWPFSGLPHSLNYWPFSGLPQSLNYWPFSGLPQSLSCTKLNVISMHVYGIKSLNPQRIYLTY